MKLYQAAVAIVVIVIGFAMVPAETVEASSVSRVTYVDAKAYQDTMVQKKSGVYWSGLYIDPYDPRRPKVVLNDKSGLRKAIEGRLKWLGIASAISIPLGCSEDDKKEVVCLYLF